jgi:hypothetical protein
MTLSTSTPPPPVYKGVLAQAKNGDEQFWNIEISCSQWEGSACIQSALIFFLISFGWVWGEDFFSLWGATQAQHGMTLRNNSIVLKATLSGGLV